MELLRLAYKNIIHRKARFILTLLSVVIGVMFVVGVFILTDGLRSTFDELADDIAGESDLVVRSEQEFGNRELATPIPVELQPVIEGLEDVVEVSPIVVEAGLVILDGEGETIESGFGGNAPIFGIAWNDSPFEYTDSFLVEDYGGVSGAPPTNDTEFAIDYDTAFDNGMQVGQIYTVIIPSGSSSEAKEIKLTGVFNFADPLENQTLGAVLIAFDIDTAIKFLNDGQGYDQYDVYITDGADVDEVSLNIRATLETSPQAVEVLGAAGITAEVVNVEEANQEVADSFNDVVNIFRNFLLGFSFIILLVSAFVIFNTFSIVLDQRIKELGLLRAIGITGRQLQRLVLSEALVIGIIATIVGLAAGVAVSFGLRAALSALGGGFPPVPTIFAIRTVIAGVFVGLGITLISALPPAFRSRRVSPIAAIREGVTAVKQTGAKRRPVLGWSALSIGVLLAIFAINSEWAVLTLFTFVATFAIYWGGSRIGNWVGHIGVFALGATWLILAAFLDLKGGESIALYGSGAIVSFIGINLVSPIFGENVARILGRVLLFRRSTPGLLGVENSARNPKRTASTSAALMVGLALVAVASVMASSLKASFEEVLDDAVSSDFIICKNNCQNPFSSNIADEIDETVDEAQSTLGFSFEDDAIRVNATQQDPDAPIVAREDVFAAWGTNLDLLESHINIDVQEPIQTPVPDNSVLIYEDRAEAYDLGVGSIVQIEFSSGGVETVEIVGVFSDNRVLQGDWVLTEALVDENVALQRDVFVSVIAEPGYSELELGASLTQVADGVDPDAKPQTRQEFNDNQTGMIDDFLIVVTFFLGLSFLVAVLGIANTLSLSIFERTREIGLLRAVGMKRKQVRRMILVEGTIIGLFGAVFGVGMGILFGIIGVNVLPDTFISKLALDYGNLIIYIILGGLAGVVSALFPAIRASRLKILDAISHD